MKKKSFAFSFVAGGRFYCASKLNFAKNGSSCSALSDAALKAPPAAGWPCLAAPYGGSRLQQNPNTSTLSIKRNP